MGTRSEEINRITSSDKSLSFTNWIEILNFFERHKDDLEIKELEKLVDRCEQCRVYLNESITDKIEKEDTNPNIYTYLDKKRSEHIKNSRSDDQVPDSDDLVAITNESAYVALSHSG